MLSVRNFPNGEIKSAHRVVIEGKECYIVSLTDRGNLLSYYVSPDGKAITLKLHGFSFSQLPRLLLEILIIGIAPGALFGCLAMFFLWSAFRRNVSPRALWCSSWISSISSIGLILSQFADFTW